MFRPHSIASVVPAFCGAIVIAMSAPLPLAPIHEAMPALVETILLDPNLLNR
jgi:hypothetical protein